MQVSQQGFGAVCRDGGKEATTGLRVVDQRVVGAGYPALQCLAVGGGEGGGDAGGGECGGGGQAGQIGQRDGGGAV